MIPIVFPHSTNWFFAHQATVLADELSRLGQLASPVSSLNEKNLDQFDRRLVFVVSFGECLSTAERTGAGSASFIKAIARFQRRILINYDSIFSNWFDEHLVMGHGFFSDIFDISMMRQEAEDSIGGSLYHWIPEAFPLSAVENLTPWSDNRPIPWALVGHANKQRAALISALVRELPPNGFVFSPPLLPYDGTYGLDGSGIRRVLEKTDFYIWGSYHLFPYHEAIRALSAVEAGAIPVKIDPLHSHRMNVPWAYSCIEEFIDVAQEKGIKQLSSEACDYVLSMGTLGENVVDVMKRIDL